MLKVLIYGFYHKGNLGDNFFAEVFLSLFPYYQLTFVDHLDQAVLQGQEAVILGGGSFLDQASSIAPEALPILQNLPLFYLGIGAETNIHPLHLALLKIAKLIVLRSPAKMELLRSINPNILLAPDLIYCHPSITPAPIAKSVLILPNISVLPQANAEHWKHIAWEYFKHEFSQFLDDLLEQGNSIKFFPMCQNDEQDDIWAAIEIVSKMQRRSHAYFLPQTKTLEETLSLVSQYEMVITQRYHGIVLAYLANVSCLTISHHDKLMTDESLPFFGANRKELHQAFHRIKEKGASSLPINRHLFIDIKEKVEELLGK